MSYLALCFVSTLEKQEGKKKKSFLAFLANKAFKNIGIQSQIPPENWYPGSDFISLMGQERNLPTSNLHLLGVSFSLSRDSILQYD